jgi:hypothetical protein
MTKTKDEADWGKEEAETISKAKYISGFATENNLGQWANYAKGNSYQTDKAQSKADLAPVQGWHDAEDQSDEWPVPQRQEEGRGWAKINPAAKPNTYTTDKGSKRD